MSTEAQFSPMTYPALRNHGVERVEEQGRARGHAAGYAAGMRAAAAEIAELRAQLQAEHADALRAAQVRADRTVEVLQQAARALNGRTAPVVASAQDALAASAIELAEAIVGQELSFAETSARSAVARALAEVEPASVHVVRMSPADLAALDEPVRAAAGVEFLADESLRPGDAVTEFADGYLDARIGSALARAKAALLGGGS